MDCTIHKYLDAHGSHQHRHASPQKERVGVQLIHDGLKQEGKIQSKFFTFVSMTKKKKCYKQTNFKCKMICCQCKKQENKTLLTINGMLTVITRSTSGSPADMLRRNTKLLGFVAKIFVPFSRKVTFSLGRYSLIKESSILFNVNIKAGNFNV